MHAFHPYCRLPLAVLLILPGCGPRVAQDDLGKIVYEVPTVPGSDQPYPLPPLERSEAPPEPAAKSSDQRADRQANPPALAP